MSGRQPFSELTKDFAPERRQRVNDLKRDLLAEMPLHELRRARELTQRDLAEMLKVNQPAVSKLEQRADVYVSSLRSYIEAVGGKLRIVAEFPQGEVAISNFSQLWPDQAAQLAITQERKQLLSRTGLVRREVSLPALPEQMFSEIESITSALRVPRDVLASDEEISYAWQELPRELRGIPPQLRGDLVARMCVAVSTGLFDGAINYIWNVTVLHLRQRIRDFGLAAVSQILQEPFEESDLDDLQDSNLIDLCLKLNLITEDGSFFLNQCRDTRNNFSAAHPAIGKINDREFITFLNRCVRYALSDESSLVGIDFDEFISAIKGGRFTEGQCDEWVTRLDATHDPQRQLLFGTLHGIYCDPASAEPSRLNALDLCTAYQSKLSAAIKSDLIDRHSDYLAKRQDKRHRVSQEFFERLGLLALLNQSERHSLISAAVRSLWDVHLAMNNFHNEPPFAERLMNLSEAEPIPVTIQEQFVVTVVGCYIGNGYGVSRAAIPYYKAMIQSFSPREIAILISANRGRSAVAERVQAWPSCRRRLLRALHLIDMGSIPRSFGSDYQRLVQTLEETK